MPDILFRGIREETGKWIYGFYYKDETSAIECIITWEDGKNRGCLSIEEMRIVHPKTVGRFTGLVDESGKKIFEGDIVEPVLTGGTHKGFSWGRQVVVFDRGAFCLKDRRGEITPMCNYAANVQFKVWGNIHDNPDLLEVTK